jgi:AraC family transcriptional regulator
VQVAGSDLKADRGKGAGSGIPGPELPSSTFALGKDLVFKEYVSSGVVEVPEKENAAHILILRTGSPSLFEWRANARDHSAELPPGTVSLVPVGLREPVRVTRPLPGLASMLEINPSFFSRAVEQIAKGGRIELIRQLKLDDPQIRRLMEALRAEIAAGSPTGTLFGESIAVALSAHVAQRYSSLTTKIEQHRGGLSRSRLNRVFEYINTNLSDKLELSMLADLAGLNLYHFARAFKQSTGESPHQYVLRRRIEEAKEFLRNPEASVFEASARTGFVDQSHFSKVFRRMVGIAPSEYRNNA